MEEGMVLEESTEKMHTFFKRMNRELKGGKVLAAFQYLFFLTLASIFFFVILTSILNTFLPYFDFLITIFILHLIFRDIFHLKKIHIFQSKKNSKEEE